MWISYAPNKQDVTKTLKHAMDMKFKTELVLLPHEDEHYDMTG